MSILSFKIPTLTRILEWKEFVPCQQWFEDELMLVKGNTRGAFNPDLRPHCKRIFEEIDKLEVTIVTLMTSSQTIKTTIGIGAILKYMDTEPEDSAIMFPRESELAKMYDGKVKPLLEGCKSIQHKIQVSEQEEKKKTRSFGISILGNILNIIATNNTKSISTKYMYYDEVSEFPVGKLEEGMERAKSFDGSGEKFLITSTQHPTKDGDDQINKYFNISEVKLQYQAKCPHCNELFYPEPEYVKFPSIEQWAKEKNIDLDEIQEGRKNFLILGEYAPYVRDNTLLECPHCSHGMTNEERRKQILEDKFEWVEVEPLSYDENQRITAWKKAENPKKHYRSIAFDVNTLSIEGYHQGNIAQKMVQAEYSKSKIQDLQMVYVGQLNRIYRTNIKKREASDILMLTNGEKWGIIPDNTAKLYFIADTQKDHYWWMIMAVKYGKLFNVVAHGKTYEDKQLKELMFAGYKTKQGETRYIDRATIDIRGYQREEKKDADGNVLETQVNTTERIKEFIIQTNIEARDNGFVKRDEHFIWGTMGQPRLKISEKELAEANKRGESPTGDMAILKTIENKENSDYTYKVLHISNLSAKTELFEAISNNIENKKAEAEGQNPTTVSNLYFINEDMKEQGLNRANPRQEDFDQMMTSEIFDYDVKDGKMKEYKTYIQIRKRNDQLDNSATAVALASIDNVGIIPNTTSMSISGYSMFKSLGKN